MAETVYLGQSIQVQVTFPSELDAEVNVRLLDSQNEDTGEVFAPTNDGDGSYSVEWSPTETGDFTLEFSGAINGDPVESLVQLTVGANKEVALGQDVEIYFTTTLSPLFLDPEPFMDAYPDATLISVMELVRRYSFEVSQILKLKPPYDEAKIPFIAFDYIRAAVMCELGRKYDFMMTGDEASIGLGDLSVMRRSNPRTIINRANADNPCELAAVLRLELIRFTGRMIAVRKGSRFESPMPTRELKDRYKYIG